MAIALGLVGYNGYYYNSKANESLGEMYNEKLLPVKWLNALRGQSRAIEALTLELINPYSLKSEEASSIKELQERVQESDKLWFDYTKTQLDPYEKERIQQYEQSLKGWRESRAKVLELASAGQKEEAYRYFKKNATPHVDKLNVLLKDLADYNAKKADEAKVQVDKESVFANKLLIGIPLLAVVISLVIGIWIARMIANPLKKCW